MLPGIAEPEMTWDSIFFGCFSSLLACCCVFAFEEYKWPFQTQDLRLTMAIDNTNFFMCEALFIQRPLKLLSQTVQLPFIHYWNEPTSKVEQRTHQCKVAVHSNLGQEMKINVSHRRCRVKSSWQNTYPEWDMDKTSPPGLACSNLGGKVAWDHQEKHQSSKFYILNKGKVPC